MQLNQPLLNELMHEAANTRKMLERVPVESFTWKPHEKSMPLLRLAAHIADLPNWLNFVVHQNEFDIAGRKYEPPAFIDSSELLQHFDDTLAKGTEALQSASDELLRQNWKLRMGDHVIFDMIRIAVVRNLVLNHMVHHRGQLSVYLRLLNIPVPGMYGPSADERF